MEYGYSYDTPVGKLWIVEKDSAITCIGFEKHSSNALISETELIKYAAFQLQEYFEGKRTQFDFPLNPEGTDFQKQVWKELCRIPYGKTCSYKDIAVAVGNPASCRAVGMANHRNPLMIVVPCHRVVGADKKLTGYAGGLDVKEFLLRMESEHSGIGGLWNK